MIFLRQIILAVLLLSAYTLSSQDITVPAEQVIDKIRGGLLGQNIGVLNGLQYEFKFIEQPGDVSGYEPSLPEGAWTDDDTDFEWVYIYTMQKRGEIFIPYEAINDLWVERINQRIWSANRFARHLMDISIKPPLTGYTAINPWAEFNMSGQFLCETFALLAPGMPQTASRIGLHYTQVAIEQEPAQTTQFFCSMIASAFIEDDIRKIIQQGLSALDENSIIHPITNDVIAWYKQYPQDWRKTWELMHNKYKRDTWIESYNGYGLNAAAVIASLLYGKGDFASSIQYAYNFGWDADCNAATVGTILGTIKGYKWIMAQGWEIVDRYKNTTRDNMPTDETITSFADRLIDLFEMVNEENGGARIRKSDGLSYIIKMEEPKPIVSLRNLNDDKKQLTGELQDQIITDIKSTNREQQARGAYFAICLGMEKEIKEKHPRQWRSACYMLSGYWKIMNNIFHGSDFAGLNNLRDDFIRAGFKQPAKKYEDEEIYNDMQVWKDSKLLY